MTTSVESVSPVGNQLIQDAIENSDPALAKEALVEIDSSLQAPLDENQRVHLLLSKSSCYAVLGDFVKARESLRSALQQQPDSDDTKLSCNFHEALLCQREAKWEEAYQKLTSILTGYEKRLTEPDWLFMYDDIQQRRASFLFTLSRFQEAIPVFKEVLCFDLDHLTRVNALVRLGRCYAEIEEWALARHSLLQARALGVAMEDENDFHWCLGLALFHTGELAEAKHEFLICEERASAREIPILDVYRWLSAICSQLGEQVESKRYAQLGRLV